jgi:hypothetical protein
MSAHQEQVDKNYEAFKKALPQLRGHEGKYALIRDGDIVAIYDTLQDAVTTAEKFYEDHVYSIQKISAEPVDLGYFSHAVSLG